MEILTDNFTILVCVGLFIVFALIGYLIDLTRKNKEEQEETLKKTYEDLSRFEDVKINDLTKQEPKLPSENKIINKTDELLEEYDNDINL